MITKIVDYTLDSSSPANPDASCPATTVGSCPVVAGPHATTLGDFPKALNFGASGELVTTLPVSELNRSKFAVRLVFKVDAAVTATQTLAESQRAPVQLLDCSQLGRQRLLPGRQRHDERL